MFLSVRKDKRTFGLVEPRYLRELSPIFLSGPNGKILPAGLKPIHSLRDLNLDEEAKVAIGELQNDRRDYWRLP